MCVSVEVLEKIKKTRGQGGMTKSQLMLAEAQAKDVEAMKTEMKNLNVRMDDFDDKLSGVVNRLASFEGKLDLLIKQSENRPVMVLIKELINSKGFWIVLGLIVIGIYGIDMAGVKELLP